MKDLLLNLINDELKYIENNYVTDKELLINGLIDIMEEYKNLLIKLEKN